MNVAVGDNLLELVYRHSIRTCIPGLLALIYIGYFLSLNTAGSSWLYFVIAAGMIQLIRPIGLKLIVKSVSLSMKTRLTLAGVHSAIYGISIGSSILFFPQLDLAQRLMISLILVGICGVAGTINAGYPPFYLSIVFPIVFPLAFFWALDPGDYMSTYISISMIVLLTLKIQLMTIMGKHNFERFSEFIELSGRQTLMSAQLTDALERAELEQEHAVASNLSKTRFLAAASHDLRQPVHILSLFGAALESKVKDDNAKAVVTDLNQTIRSLSTQLNELLDMARFDSESPKPTLKPVELGSVVNLIADELAIEATGAGIDIINSIDTTMYVYSDKSMLLQMLRNIIGNSIKYTHKGSVTLSASNDGDRIALSVLDTGIGMNEEEQEHIFEEFFQVNNRERCREKGIGLGLAIVKRLANVLSHEITISSRTGEGTCVLLHMKACDNQTIEENNP